MVQANQGDPSIRWMQRRAAHGKGQRADDAKHEKKKKCLRVVVKTVMHADMIIVPYSMDWKRIWGTPIVKNRGKLSKMKEAQLHQNITSLNQLNYHDRLRRSATKRYVLRKR